MKFITLDEVLAIHDRMLGIGGGQEGIHDFTLLHSAIERPKAQFGARFLYSSIFLMAAALLHSLVKNHPFNDGNKRTAYFSTVRLLHKNGRLLAPKGKEIISFMVDVDTKNKTIEEISVWLKTHTHHLYTP